MSRLGHGWVPIGMQEGRLAQTCGQENFSLEAPPRCLARLTSRADCMDISTTSLRHRTRSIRTGWRRLNPLIRVAIGIFAFFVVLDFAVHGNLTLSTPSMPVTVSGSNSIASVAGVSCVSQGTRSGYLTAAGTITPKETLPLGLVVNATITDAKGQQFGFGQAMISHVESGQSQRFEVSINPGDRPPTTPAHGCFVTWLAVVPRN
jgi:hypothetical protein